MTADPRDHEDMDLLASAGFVLVARSTDGISRGRSKIYHTRRCVVVADLNRDSFRERLVDRLGDQYRECKYCSGEAKGVNQSECPIPGCDSRPVITASHIQAEHGEQNE